MISSNVIGKKRKKERQFLCETTFSLPKGGCAPKVKDCLRRVLVSDAIKWPRISLKKLGRSTDQTGGDVYRTLIALGFSKKRLSQM